MPTRTYTNFDLIIDVDQVSINGNSTDVGTKFNRSSSGSSVAGTPATSDYDYVGSAYINFNIFPTIPESAQITKINFSSHIVANLNDTNIAGDTLATFSNKAITFPATILASDTASIPDGNHMGGESLDENLTWEINYTPAKTKAEIIALFGNASNFGVSGTAFLHTINGSATAPTGTSTFSVSSSSLSIIITYDLEHYSWYIYPTTTIINGQPVEVIEDDTTDIIALTPEDEIPEGYEFYGTGEAFPDGPEYVWWESDDFYELFIYSPISPGSSWTPVGGVPTCTNCTSSTLGSLDILVADASGIYTLVPNKTNDSVYTRTGFSVFVEEVEVKIPNPFGKIGFIP